LLYKSCLFIMFSLYTRYVTIGLDVIFFTMYVKWFQFFGYIVKYYSLCTFLSISQPWTLHTLPISYVIITHLHINRSIKVSTLGPGSVTIYYVNTSIR
jgi:hypothetical protein